MERHGSNYTDGGEGTDKGANLNQELYRIGEDRQYLEKNSNQTSNCQIESKDEAEPLQYDSRIDGSDHDNVFVGSPAEEERVEVKSEDSCGEIAVDSPRSGSSSSFHEHSAEPSERSDESELDFSEEESSDSQPSVSDTNDSCDVNVSSDDSLASNRSIASSSSSSASSSSCYISLSTSSIDLSDDDDVETGCKFCQRCVDEEGPGRCEIVNRVCSVCAGKLAVKHEDEDVDVGVNVDVDVEMASDAGSDEESSEWLSDLGDSDEDDTSSDDGDDDTNLTATASVSSVPAVGSAGEFPGVWNELRQNDQLCDGIIKCRDGRAVKIHRAILSAVSPYFRAIFTNSLRSGDDEETQVTVDIQAELLGSILDYAYTGACTVNSENVEALLPAADQYEVLGVIQLCCQFLFNELRPDNCLGILRFAKHYFCRDLEYNSMHFALVNFKRVMHESAEFPQLQFQELSAILRDDELNVRSEEIVYDAIRSWTECDRTARIPHVPELLTTVRFGLMNFKFFTSQVLKWDVVKNSPACQDALYPASLFLTELNSKEGGETDLNDPLARPRIPHEILFAVGGWSAGSPTSFVETYDTRADRWFLSVNTDLTPRAYHGICSLENLIYMVGGFDGNEHFNTVRCFNPLTKAWRERACMYHARCYVSVVAHDGWVYALGGYNGRNRMCSVERYDPNRNQWEMVTPMNKQRSDASAASLRGKIYIVGGFNGQEVLVSGEVYDPVTLQWTFIPQMTNPRSGVSLVAYRDSLYALGGFSGFSRLNSGEKYNPDSGESWLPISDMFSPRSNFATVVLDDLVFAIGGFNGTTTISYVECYDADSNEWYDAACMNLNRSALSACVLSGLPNGREYSYLSKAQEHEQGGGGAKCQHRHN